MIDGWGISCLQMIVPGPHWRQINIGSGKGLVPSSITWANVDPDLCHPMVSQGHSELNYLSYICQQVTKLQKTGVFFHLNKLVRTTLKVLTIFRCSATTNPRMFGVSAPTVAPLVLLAVLRLLSVRWWFGVPIGLGDVELPLARPLASELLELLRWGVDAPLLVPLLLLLGALGNMSRCNWLWPGRIECNVSIHAKHEAADLVIK